MFRIGALILMQNEECNHPRISRRRLRDASSPLELPDTSLNKAAFSSVLEVLTQSLQPTKKSIGIPTIIKLCTCLRFFAEGGYQKGIARYYEVGLAQSTFCEVLSQMLYVLKQHLCSKWITYLTTEESRVTAQGFYGKYGIPGVVGCIDQYCSPKQNPTFVLQPKREI